MAQPPDAPFEGYYLFTPEAWARFDLMLAQLLTSVRVARAAVARAHPEDCAVAVTAADRYAQDLVRAITEAQAAAARLRPAGPADWGALDDVDPPAPPDPPEPPAPRGRVIPFPGRPISS